MTLLSLTMQPAQGREEPARGREAHAHAHARAVDSCLYTSIPVAAAAESNATLESSLEPCRVRQRCESKAASSGSTRTRARAREHVVVGIALDFVDGAPRLSGAKPAGTRGRTYPSFALLSLVC